MIVEVHFLGTGGVMPTRRRMPVCIVVRIKGWCILLECPENCQLYFTQDGIGINKPLVILISHLHADHILGLPGLLLSMSILGRERVVTVAGPKGLSEFLENMFNIMRTGTEYELRIKELVEKEETVLDSDEYIIRAVLVRHTLPSYAFFIECKELRGEFDVEKALKLGVPKGPLWRALKMGRTVILPSGKTIKPENVIKGLRKGIKIAYSSDTRPSAELIEHSRGADMLIHESTHLLYNYNLAFEGGHSTAFHAAEVASAAEVSKLVLVHLSPRYQNNIEEFKKEASQIFKG
ncbi:MAG: ribonuclease Z, partial [Thermoprotei archaeon]